MSTVLTTRQICRKKLPTFFGSRDNFYHGFRETINNAVDELNENFESGTITIRFTDDGNRVSVEDTGRGLPFFKEDNYVKVFETIFAGTKTDGGGLEAGTNGVGLCVLNHTSSYFRATSRHHGVEEVLVYKDGGQLVEKDSYKSKYETTGTTIEFTLDKEMYTQIQHSKSAVFGQIQLFSVVTPKIKYVFYWNGELVQEFHHETIRDFYDTFQHTSEIITGESVSVESGGEQSLIEGVISTQVTPFQMTYLNGNNLNEKGTIYDGVIYGARKFFEELGKKYSLQDIRDSLGFVINFKSNNVEYTNQTKYSTAKKLYEKVAKDYIYFLLKEESVKNPNNIEKMIKHINAVYKANENSSKAKDKLKKELTKKIEGVGKKPSKLKNCRKKGEEAELFICEGDSALSGFMEARDSNFQAGFPIRGKFLNVLKANKKKIFSNEEVKNIIQLLGIGYSDKGEELDLDNLNFGKIVLLVDADPDGYAIACLLLNFFWRYFPQLLTEGRIYKAETPLFEIRDKKDRMYYAYSDEEKDKIVKKVDGAKVSRVKGLGEQDSEVLWDTGLNPKTRKLTQFKVDNSQEFNNKIRDWFADDTAPRKEIISNNDINLEMLE